MTFNIYNAEFRPGDQDAYITGTGDKIGEFLDDGPGFDGVTDHILLDGTKADEQDLSVDLGGNATDPQVLFIDATDYGDCTFIKVTESDADDCVVFSNVVSIKDPFGTTYDASNGDTNGGDLGDLTIPINDSNDDEKFTIKYYDDFGNLKTMFFESDDHLNLYVDFICFARGTRIMTDRGEIAVEELEPGDTALTMDHGYQPIRWIGSSSLPAKGKFAPILIRKGALGNERDLRVSPQHRMLLRGWYITMLTDQRDALVAAKSLVNDSSIVRQEGGTVDYYHILFDQHEIIFAEGVPSESYHPGDMSIENFDEATREEIFALFPHLREGAHAYGVSARVSLKPHEAEVVKAYQ